MKKFTYSIMFVLTFFFLLKTHNVNASQVKLDFTVVGTVNQNDTTMNTTIPNMNGYIVWSANNNVGSPYDPTGFHAIDGLVAPNFGPTNPYWLVIGMPQYLKITFPEPIFISKIVTYNIGMTRDWWAENVGGSGTGPEAGNRWTESSLWITSEGTDYDMGDIRVSDTPQVTDHVDLDINKTVTEIEYLFENINSPDYNYYAVNRIEIYTTEAIPEPTTIMLLLTSVSALMRRFCRKKIS